MSVVSLFSSCGEKKKKKKTVPLSIFLLTSDPSVVLKHLGFVLFVICCFWFVVLGVCVSVSLFVSLSFFFFLGKKKNLYLVGLKAQN